MKAKKIMEKIKKLQTKTEVIPWFVWTAFWDKSPFFNIIGDQVTFDGDYKTLQEMRNALDWMVDQFGGEVTWSEEE